MDAYNWSMEFSTGEVTTSQGQVLMRTKKGQPRAGRGPVEEERRAAMMDAGEEKGSDDEDLASGSEERQETESPERALEIARFTVQKCQAHLHELEQASKLGQLQVEVNGGYMRESKRLTRELREMAAIRHMEAEQAADRMAALELRMQRQEAWMRANCEEWGRGWEEPWQEKSPRRGLGKALARGGQRLKRRETLEGILTGLVAEEAGDGEESGLNDSGRFKTRLGREDTARLGRDHAARFGRGQDDARGAANMAAIDAHVLTRSEKPPGPASAASNCPEPALDWIKEPFSGAGDLRDPVRLPGSAEGPADYSEPSTGVAPGASAEIVRPQGRYGVGKTCGEFEACSGQSVQPAPGPVDHESAKSSCRKGGCYRDKTESAAWDSAELKEAGTSEGAPVLAPWATPATAAVFDGRTLKVLASTEGVSEAAHAASPGAAHEASPGAAPRASRREGAIRERVMLENKGGYPPCAKDANRVDDQLWGDAEFLDHVLRSCRCPEGLPCYAEEAWKRVTGLKDWHRGVEARAYVDTLATLRGERPRGLTTVEVDEVPTMPDRKGAALRRAAGDRAATDERKKLEERTAGGTEWCDSRLSEDEAEDEREAGECAALPDPEEPAGDEAKRVRVRKRTKLPAWAETDVEVVLEGSDWAISQEGAMILPGRRDRGRPWRAACTLVMPDGAGRAVIRICNASHEPLTIPAGQQVGVWDATGQQPLVHVLEAAEDEEEGETKEEAARVAPIQPGEAGADDPTLEGDKWVPTDLGQKGPHTEEELRAYLAKDSPNLTDEQREEALQVLLRYPEVVTSVMGCTPLVEHHIETGTARPIYGARFRKSPAEVEETQRQVDELMKRGVVKPSDSPWAAPVVLARKSDGTWRFCVDYRRLNAVTERDSYPLPRIDATLDRLGGSMYFSTMDLLSGFWQVPVRESDKAKTAFCTTSGLYEWNVMPMGLINSPATFQRLMDRVLGKLRYTFALVYLDDIMVHSETWEEHLEHLTAVFECLKAAGLTVKLKKCHFGREEVEYLGHVVGREGIKVDQKKVAAIRELRAPRNVSEVRTLLGMVAYYRRFIPDCSALCKPLHQLTRKDHPFVWDASCEAAMAELKRLLTMAPALRPPDFTKMFRVRTDASYHGLGATLMQGGGEDGDDWYTVAYASRSLTGPETRYSATDLECRGVLFAVSQFRPYIFGRKFQLETDHRALVWLLTTIHSNGRLQRSAMEMQTYQYDVVHKAGISMQDADCLSRLTSIKAVCAQHADRPGDGTARVSVLEGAATLNLAAVSTDKVAQPQARQMTRREIIRQLRASLYQEERWFDVRAMKQWEKNGGLPGRRPLVSAWARRKARDYELGEDGLLYRVSGEGPLGGPRRLLVIPTEMQREVLYACHEHMVSGGHLGRDRTIQRIQERYYWPGLVADAERWCASCVQCLEAKSPARQHRIRLEAVPVPGAPWDLVSVDATGPFPTTKNGNTQIVVFTDHLTRWVEAFAVPDIKTSTLADLLVERIVCRHGAPRTLLSDQGSSFVSELAAAVYHRLGVNKIQASAYHPQTNGLVERYNRTMKEMLTKYVDSRHTDWDTYLPYVTFAYNSSVHRSLEGLSPFQMLHGRKPTLPIDAMLLPAATQAVLAQDEREYYGRLQEGLQMLHSHGRHALQRAQRERTRTRSERGNVPSYKEGDMVWIKVPTTELTAVGEAGLARKLMPKWRGPYLVVRVVGPLNYVVQGPGGYEKLVHLDRVKLHHADNGHNPPDEDEPTVDEETKGHVDEGALTDEDEREAPTPAWGGGGEDKEDDSASSGADSDVETLATPTRATTQPVRRSSRLEGRQGARSGTAEAKEGPAAERKGEEPDGLSQTQEASEETDARQREADRAATARRRRNLCRVCGQPRAGHKCPGHYVPQTQAEARQARHAAAPKEGPDPQRIVFGIRRRDGSATVVFKGPGRVVKSVGAKHVGPERVGGDDAWEDTCCMCDDGGELVCCYSCREAAHLPCLQRQDMARLGQGEAYLCAGCAHHAWTEVLGARSADPGRRELRRGVFRADRPTARLSGLEIPDDQLLGGHGAAAGLAAEKQRDRSVVVELGRPVEKWALLDEGASGDPQKFAKIEKKPSLARRLWGRLRGE
jgi:transposase InsO family protein